MKKVSNIVVLQELLMLIKLFLLTQLQLFLVYSKMTRMAAVLSIVVKEKSTTKEMEKGIFSSMTSERPKDLSIYYQQVSAVSFFSFFLLDPKRTKNRYV